MAGKRRPPSGTSAMPWRERGGAGTDARSLPASRMVPALIGRRPAIALMSVVLPAPFGPTTVTRSRGRTLSDTSQTATASPWATSRCSISSIGLAQICADDVRVAHHLPWESLGDDLPVAQHHDTVGEVENGAHDVLDEDDRRAAVADLADELERVGHLRRRQPREHLVQQHQPRLGREGAGEIEKLAFEQVQLVGQRVGSGLETGEGEPGSREAAPRLAAVAAATDHRRAGDVVDDAEPAEPRGVRVVPVRRAAGAAGPRRRLARPAPPPGGKRMPRSGSPPMSARFRIALSPPVRDCVSVVTMAAPTAGPYQKPVPPRAAIMIASTVRPTGNVSATVTYVTNIA